MWHVCTTLVLIALSLRGVTHASGHAPLALRGNGAARGAKKSFVNHTSAAFYEALFEGHAGGTVTAASLARGTATFGALPACPRRRCVTAQPLARMPLRDARARCS